MLRDTLNAIGHELCKRDATFARGEACFEANELLREVVERLRADYDASLLYSRTTEELLLKAAARGY